MTEHVHDWAWFKYDGHYHCQVVGCDERRHPITMESSVNAAKILNAEDARLLAQNIQYMLAAGYLIDSMRGRAANAQRSANAYAELLEE